MCACRSARMALYLMRRKGVPFKLHLRDSPKGIGWEVVAGESIPAGAYVCEYAGEVLDEKEADEREKQDYAPNGGCACNHRS